MSTLYQPISPNEPSESTTVMTESRGSLEHGAAVLQSGEARNESSGNGPPAASKRVNSTVTDISNEGTIVLSRSLSRGQLLECIIHFFAISVSIGICLLHFLKVYWTDESTLSKRWRWVSSFVSLDINDIIKALQFAAKVHEILIVASIGAIVLYFARRRLVGDEGIALGLLMSSYRIDTPSNMLSSKFWSALSFDSSNLDPAAIGLSLLLLVSAILCQLVGPASAGVMQPSLDWWNVSNPYNGQPLPLYLSVRGNETYPRVLDNNTWPLHAYDPNIDRFVAENATDCLTNAVGSWCPAFGVSVVENWAISNYEDHATPNITVTGTSGTQRALTADLIANGTAIAATQSNWVIRMFGLFATYVKHRSAFAASSITLPMYTSTDPMYAPVVQVQCQALLPNDTRNSVRFLTDQLTNYTDSSADRYNPQLSWSVPPEALSLHNQQDYAHFEWVDLSKQTTTGMWRPSLGAVAKIPGWVNGRPGFYIIPCIIDARWAASSAIYQPIISDVIISNLSSPADLASRSNSADSISSKLRLKPKPKPISRQQLGIGDAIQIGLNWANLLDTPIYSSNDTRALTNIEAMLNIYVRIDENNGTDYAAFTVGVNNNTYVRNTTQLMHAAENTTATILSLTIADALSRLSDGIEPWNLIVLNTTRGGNVTWTAIDFDYYSINSSDATFMKQFTSLRVQVHRYGWAYGWGAVIILDVVVLLMHVFMVVSYAGYHLLHVLCFRERWWMTDAWNNTADLIILAWDSSSTTVFRKAEGAKPSLWAQNIKVRERIGGDAMELVAGRPKPGEGRLQPERKYM
ncbi:uncharacterized protein TrAtP1_013154 [Trichoderma atroviride]|uniref:uncharacterized protein n=1 Tax=Hypocrea atroviridis TaxID=63577 RepID=UPI003334265E|nr:hypothetical protein TrAtP1_013154 [Trichoderma atroviride]